LLTLSILLTSLLLTLSILLTSLLLSLSILLLSLPILLTSALRVIVPAIDVGVLVVVDVISSASVPTAIPVVVAFVDQGHDSHPQAERQKAGCEHLRTGVSGRRRRCGIAGRSRYRGAVHRRRIVLGNIYRVLLRRLNDHDLLRCALFTGLQGRRRDFDLLLRRVLECASFYRPIPKPLDCVHDIVRLVVVRLAQVRRPREVVIHCFDHIAELRQRSDAGIPRLRVYRLGELVTLEAGILLQPFPGFHDLSRKRRSDQDARHQQVRVKRDRRYHLLQLLGGGLPRCGAGRSGRRLGRRFGSGPSAGKRRTGNQHRDRKNH
jgi:hypothetical protein